jgi:bifunctional UDP-N-acetylglucosamine pyrophosphorylase/glucosamine-1-phosphate N-acetyltransferase
MSQSNRAVVVLAAGQGTRMKSSLPKVLHPLGGMPLIGHVLDTAMSLRPDVIVAVVRHERDQVARAVTEHYEAAVIVDQDDQPGTGRAVELALAALPAGFDGSVVVLSGDVPLLEAETVRELVESHEQANRALTLLSVDLADPTGLGRILRDSSGAFTGIVEEKDATNEQRQITEINGGVYVFESGMLTTVLARIGSNNAQGEKYLTDAASQILELGGAIDALIARDPWMIAGINDRAQLADAARELNARIIRRHQLAGVTIQDPNTTWIDTAVSLGQDVTVLPGTQILGATTVESGATIGPDTTLVDCEVGERASIRRSEATLAVIDADASVGPFSYLRPGTTLGVNGKIGAFVETKNARIGDDSKVPHLSYVGDAEIGEHSNVGAGTIFANYDGVAKHETVVGSHVKIGSKNVLVAPVRIEDGTYTAAGTVVRKDVPAGSLAMNVAPQRNVEGWVEKNRPGSDTAEAAQQHGDTQ